MDHDLECEEAYLRGEKDQWEAKTDRRTMTDKTIDVQTDAPTQALTVREAMQAVEPAKQENKATAQEMRVVEVSEALAPAYAKASTLELTDAEVQALMEPFPDEVVEVRPHDGLIYIPHIFVSDRLNRIFKPGKWALIRRREWFDGSTMFGEYVLVIRGCYVGESVGGHPYVKNNPKTNFSDVLESTAAEALRRICGKRLSLGSQVWSPEYCRQWTAKYQGCERGKYFKKTAPSAPPTQTTAAPKPAAAPAPPAGDDVTDYPVVTVLTVKEVHSKPDSAKKWTAYFIRFSDGFGELEAATFDRKIADFANDLANTGESGTLRVKPGKKPNTKEIVSLERADVPPDAPQGELPIEDNVPDDVPM